MNRILIRIFSTIFLIAIVFGIVGWWYFDKNRDQERIMEEIAKVDGARELYNMGDFSGALNLYSEVTPNTNNGAKPDAFVQISKAYTLNSAGGTENIREAIAVLMDIIRDSSYSEREKAWAVTALTGVYYTDRSKETLAEIQKYDTFSHFLNLPPKQFIFEIAKMGDAYSPTSLGKIRLAFFYSGEILDNSELTNETKLAYAQDIQILVDQSDLYFDQESVIYDQASKVSQQVQLKHLQSFVLGAAAVADPALREEAMASFADTLKLVEQNPENVLAQRISVYTRFYYSGYMNTFDPDVYNDEIDRQLDALVATPNETNILSAFIRFMKSEYERTPDEQDHNYIFFESLRVRHEQFDTFVQSHVA